MVPGQFAEHFLRGCGRGPDCDSPRQTRALRAALAMLRIPGLGGSWYATPHGSDSSVQARGQREYQLIKKAGFHRFPPRLPEQPNFYAVANEE
jgi:hypothetical protein